MSERKRKTLQGTHNSRFTDRDLDIVYKAMYCTKGVNKHGEIMVDYDKLYQLAGYSNPKSMRTSWTDIKKKLVANSEAMDRARAELNRVNGVVRGTNENPMDNTGGGQQKRKASANVSFESPNDTDPRELRFDTLSAFLQEGDVKDDNGNNAIIPAPKAKKPRAAKTPSPRKKTSKKGAGKKAVTVKEEEEEKDDETEPDYDADEIDYAPNELVHKSEHQVDTPQVTAGTA